MVNIFWRNFVAFWRNIPKNLIKKAILVAGAISSGALVLAVIGVITLLVVDGRSGPPPVIMPSPTPAAAEYDEPDPYDLSAISHDEDVEDPQLDEGSLLRPPARTNFLIAGLDHQNLADVLIVGCFYRDSGDIRMMSIPRDMYTRLPDHRLEQMRAEGLRPPAAMKINELRAFGGRNGIYYVKQQLGEMLGVEFHYYVEMNLAAFRRIVDAVDGVYIDVPVPMYYNPEDQDLYINLSPGLQRLDGYAAEGLVRFRGFPTGDLGRNQTHMEFMTQIISQVLTRDAIMNDPLAMVSIVLNDVRSNVGLDAMRYIPYIGNISSDSITTFVMPGRGAYVNRVSWFLPDAQRVPDVINQIFYAEMRREAGE